MQVCLRIIVGCLIVLLYAAPGQSNNTQTRIKELLRSIVPIETTAENVKTLLGQPVSTSPDFHEFDEFNVLVSYTSGLACDHRCKERGRACGWNVPRDRVNTFTIIVKGAFHQRDLKNFGIDLTRYEKDVDPSGHVPETIYTNNEKGIRVYISGEQVTSFALFPAKKYLHLMCPQTCEKPVCQNEALPPTPTSCRTAPSWLQ